MSPGRRFEAIVLGPDALAVALRAPEAVVPLLESACGVGIHVAIIGGPTAAALRRLRAPPGCGGSLSILDPTPSVEVARRRSLEDLWRCGIAPGQVLVLDERAGLEEALGDQIARRRRRELPRPEPDPAWTLSIEGIDAELERVHESLLTLADGAIGTRGSAVGAHAASAPAVFAEGLYGGRGRRSELLRGPLWNRLPIQAGDGLRLRRTLDLHAGVLYQELGGGAGDPAAAVALFSSLARPGTVALRAAAPSELWNGPAPALTPGEPHIEVGRDGESDWARVRADPGGLAAAARQTELEREGMRAVDRIGVYRGGPRRKPERAEALRGLAEAEDAGFEALLGEHRSAWARRWERADVRIDGDPELQLAVRFALFHLMASARDRGEAAVGARGLTGSAYRGHVFWDACVYVLPFLAATHPAAARAMLEYRVRRLPAALRAARALGRGGARLPWESAADGSDVTPRRVRTRAGEDVAIRTGELEEHIVADVAWGAACYLEWSDDDDFRRGSGARLLAETARYWASRVEREADGSGHIRGVIGPDEYHVGVDDNAYTNVMARWNLRYAAGLEGGRASADERREWREVADALVDGYDAETGLYEQFAGFFDLEPIVIRDIAPSRPIAADLLLGHERVAGAQVVKQADVLMLHHLVPDQAAPGSLAPNLAYYEPRTAHASSLSPGVHAALLARAGKADAAREALRLAARIDLDDLSGTTAGGLHVAAMGSVWHALAFGFAGLRSREGVLRVDPRLPDGWEGLELRLRFRGVAASVRFDPRGAGVASERPIAVATADEQPTRTGGDWRVLRLGPGGRK